MTRFDEHRPEPDLPAFTEADTIPLRLPAGFADHAPPVPDAAVEQQPPPEPVHPPEPTGPVQPPPVSADQPESTGPVQPPPTGADQPEPEPAAAPSHPPSGPIPAPDYEAGHPPSGPIRAPYPPQRPAPERYRYPPGEGRPSQPAPGPPRPQPMLPPPVETAFTSAAPSGGPDHHPAARLPRMPSPRELGLIRRAKPLPQHGWRKVVHKVTGLNPGESEREHTRAELVARVNQPVRGDYSIAVLSLKGGVGKTTTTVGLGSTFAAIRGDRVIAVDANPDFGTLAQRGPDESRSTVRDLLLDDNIFRYSDIRRHTSQASSRLEILASERDPATSEAFSEADYRDVIRLLQRFYNIILTDCGTGLVHSAMAGVLAEADAIVMVASPAIDAARSALATLDWLECHGFAHLVPTSTVVVSAARPGKMSVDIDLLANQFLSRVRSFHVIPFDDHLATGSEVVLEMMGARTRQAFLELAASIADGFSTTKRPERMSPR